MENFPLDMVAPVVLIVALTVALVTDWLSRRAQRIPSDGAAPSTK